MLGGRILIKFQRVVLRYFLFFILKFINQTAMHLKWKIYLVTLFTYATIHSIRTMWSAIKSDLTVAPFSYQVSFLGTLDMVVLFTLAVSMNIIGPKIEKWGPKKVLMYGLLVLFVLTALVGLFLEMNFTSQAIYVIVFGLGVGIFSSLGWPSCLCMVSYYFDKNNGMALSAWNGSSQLGDLISLMTYYLIVISKQWPTQSSFFLIAFYILVCGMAVKFVIPNQLKKDQKSREQASVQIKQGQAKEVELIEQKIADAIEQKVMGTTQPMQYEMLEQKSDKEESQTKSVEPEGQVEPSNQRKSEQIQQKITAHSSSSQSQIKRVNILTVWCLPGVAFNVLAYGLIKSVNAFIVSWLVYYLLMLDMGSQAVIMTIFWSVSVFVGGLVCGFLNKKFNKLIFIAQLVLSAICFILLQEFHLKIYQTGIIALIIICAFFFGGPYNLMSTAIPIVLGNQQSVKQYENGKSSIISLMEGFGQLFCGFSLLIVPLFGVRHIHTAGAVYCGLACCLLLAEYLRLRKLSHGKRQTKELTKSIKDEYRVKEQQKATAQQ